MAQRNNWSEEETILAFYYYCQIPYGKIGKGNQTIIRIANMIGRKPSAVARKMANLAHYDPDQIERGVVGLSHGSKLDEQVVKQFKNDWESLTYKAKTIEADCLGKHVEELIDNDAVFPEGQDRSVDAKTRINQDFFRRTVLSAYNTTCCITGMQNPCLLIASHIKPWKSADPKLERTNPRNGLCLNALYDKAFDRGLLTVLPDYTIRVSSMLKGMDKGTQWILSCDKQKINLPKRYLPDRVYLEYHNDIVFKP